MSKLTQDKPGSRRPKPRKWFRPKSIKKMMVEMERPFVWPEEPKEFDMYVLCSFIFPLSGGSEERKDGIARGVRIELMKGQVG